MKRAFLVWLFGIVCHGIMFSSTENSSIDLSGLWRFQLDPMGFGKTPGSELYLRKLTETIELPGSADERGKGIQNFVAHVDRLSRKYEYCGQAWNQREVVIPDTWKDKGTLYCTNDCV